MNIAVVGSGGWGTAVAVLLDKNGHNVRLWSFDADQAENLCKNRENPLLAGVKIPQSIEITTDLSIVSQVQMIVLAVPSFAVAQTAEKMKPYIKDGHIIVCISKGFDRENGYCVFSQSIEKILGDKIKVCALTGPSHAEEVGRNMPTAVVAACRDEQCAVEVQHAFFNKDFRVYAVRDIIGAQLGAALKNVIALAAGICDGLELGDNTKAALMTRGLAEIKRLGIAMGGEQSTFAGLSGMGDLIVTCMSMHSRNRRAGILVGQGMNINDAMKKVGAVVEGYYATEGAYMMSKKYGVRMPITTVMYGILYEGMDVRQAIMSLMSGACRWEN